MDLTFKIEKGQRKEFHLTRIKQKNGKWFYFPKKFWDFETHCEYVANKASEVSQTKFTNSTSFTLFFGVKEIKEYVQCRGSEKKFVFRGIELVSKLCLLKKKKRIQRLKFDFTDTESSLLDFLSEFDKLFESKDEVLKKVQLYSYVLKEDHAELALAYQQDYSAFRNSFFSFYKQKQIDYKSNTGKSLEQVGSLRKYLHLMLDARKYLRKDIRTNIFDIAMHLSFADKLDVSDIKSIRNFPSFVDYIVFKAKNENLVEAKFVEDPDESENGTENEPGNGSESSSESSSDDEFDPEKIVPYEK